MAEYSEDGKILVKGDNVECFVIPYGVTTIDYNAFAGFKKLKKVEIPNTIEIIKKGAFEDCESLIDVELPNSIKHIGERSFRGCTSLKSIEIPDSVESIGKCCFGECESLTELEIPDSVQDIGAYAFINCGFIYFNFPETSDSIPWGCFTSCKSLKSINISDNTLIGSESFAGCTSLESITFSSRQNTILESTFRGCSSLSNVVFPKNIYRINKKAFEGCDSLKSITIHSELTVIESAPFCKCSNLENINVETENRLYNSIDGVLYNKIINSIIQYPAGKKDKEYCIPEFIQKIEYASFVGAKNLMAIFVPETVKSLDVSAFDDELKELHLLHSDPESISIISENWNDQFFRTYKETILYVPVGTGYAYRHHSFFSKFKEVKIERCKAYNKD